MENRQTGFPQLPQPLLLLTQGDEQRRLAYTQHGRGGSLSKRWVAQFPSVANKWDLSALAEGDVPLSEVANERCRDLELRGFARRSGKKVRSSCRLMCRYAQQQAGGVADLRRLFGDSERFGSNIRSLLELRLAQVRGADPDLLGYVKRAIRDLEPEPAFSIVWARSIAERALDLIWEAELPSDKSMPEPWKFAGVQFDARGQFPGRRGPQCGILRSITGTEKQGSVSKFVTKPTYLLVDHIQSVGDFGQHKQEATVSISMAAAFCLSAIGLCESLVHDLAALRAARS